MASSVPEKQSSGFSLWRFLGVLLVGLACLLALGTVTGALFEWPTMDEGNYMLESARMAHGQLPYRDFYEFLTPGTAILGALWIKGFGYNVTGFRLLVVGGWLLELFLVDRIFQPLMRDWKNANVWRFLLLFFLWLTMARYPIFQHHVWSGLLALAATAAAVGYLRGNAGTAGRRSLLALSGVLCALVFWFTESTGVAIAGGLLVFSLAQAFWRERETSLNPVSFKAFIQQWWRSWGQNWLLPFALVHAIAIGLLLALSLFDAFFQDALVWLWQGHYLNTTLTGYFVTFIEECRVTILPFLGPLPPALKLLFWWRIPVVIQVGLIAALPVIGLLGMGGVLPGRLSNRVFAKNDETLLLLSCAALVMILSTFSYSTSIHIVSNGALPLSLGMFVLFERLQRINSRFAWPAWVVAIFCGLLMLGSLSGNVMQWQQSPWLAMGKIPGSQLNEFLMITGLDGRPEAIVKLLQRLQDASAKERSVFILSEHPSLYLPFLNENATRFTLTLPVYTSDAQFREIVADVHRNQPLYIVDDQVASYDRLKSMPHFSHYSREALRMPLLEAVIQQDYRLIEVDSPFLVYERIHSYVKQ